MSTLVLENPPTVSRTWIDSRPSVDLPQYSTAGSTSVDFASGVFKAFHQRVTKLSSYELLTKMDKDREDDSLSLSKVQQSVTVDVSQGHPDLPRAEARLEYLANLDLSQSFEDLEQPSEDTIREAGVLLRKLAAFGIDRHLPDLGLDSDGSLVFSFHPERTGLIGSLSVFGDGTYSYCIEFKGKSVEAGEAVVGGPIADELKAYLTR